MGVAGAIGAATSAIGGLVGQEGANRAADAAGSAAREKQMFAQQNFKRMQDLTNRATTSGILQFEKDLSNQEKNLARQEQMISQIDPTIIEASQQALKLLRGEQSSALNPLKNQRAQQRQQLVNSLREQLGPGAETSSAGIQALSKFDSESSNIFASGQQAALSGLGGLATQFGQLRPDMLREIAARSGFGQGKSNLLFKQADIMNSAGQGLIDTAGAQYVGDQMRGQYQQSLGNSLFGAGAQVGLSSLFGASKPATNSTLSMGAETISSGTGGRAMTGSSYRNFGAIG